MIAQLDKYGCGVACVANRLDINYQSALELFDNPLMAIDGRHCYSKNIADALNKAGLKVEAKYIKPKIKARIYQIGTIVFIKKSNKYLSGHYLLRTESGWVDPWLNFPLWPAVSGIRRRLPGKPSYVILSNT